MKNFHAFTMTILFFVLLGFLLSAPFADRSLAQTKTPTPKPPTPFVTRPGSPEQVLYSGAQLQAAYDLKPLIDAGFDGEGQTIALVETNNFSQNDLDSYIKLNHLPKPNIQIQAAPSGQPLPIGLEATADIEVILAIAPKANIIVYELPMPLDAFALIANGSKAQVVSFSLEICELVLGNPFFNDFHHLITTIRAKNISVFVATGDWGAFGCAHQIQADSKTEVPPEIAKKLAVSGVASDPAVTAVGGTILHLKNGRYSSEEVWNLRQADILASGGGVSVHWPLPDYQKNYLQSGDLNERQTRQLPDVVASADNFGCFANGFLGNCHGTSLSAPLWAVGTLLVNQYLEARLKDPAARLNAPDMLYQIKTAYVAGKLDKIPFHDVVKGDNRFYVAGPGYNLATGLGAPDFYNIALDAEQLYKQKQN